MNYEYQPQSEKVAPHVTDALEAAMNREAALQQRQAERTRHDTDPLTDDDFYARRALAAAERPMGFMVAQHVGSAALHQARR